LVDSLYPPVKGHTMAVKKNEAKEKKTVQIKATTGAWWKSTTTVDEVQKEESAAENEKEAVTKEQKSGKSVSQKRRGRKKPETTDAEAEGSVEAPKESRQPKARKTTAGRSPAKKPSGRSRRAAAEQRQDKKEEVEQQGLQEATAEPQSETQPVEEKTPPKRTRGRRKRGSSKKAPEADSVSDVKESEAETTAGAGEEEKKQVVSDGAEPGDLEEEAGQQAAPDEQEADEEKPARAAKSKAESKKVCKLLINAEEPEECRLALLEDGRLESIHVSTIARTQTRNNIYKARIVAIEPSLQAAFVDYGTEKNGFLPFSEIHPEYYKQDLSDEARRLVENNQWKKLSISDAVEKGQEILAQVVKEEVGKKGANMTTFLSIPGRCVVLMPGSDSAGISRKISGEQRRSQLRDTMLSMDLPEGIGWIVRTASVDITQEALKQDVEYLLGLWNEIKNKGQEMNGVGQVYEDHRSVLRFLREHYDPSIQEILVDDRTALEQVKEFVKMLPEQQRDVKVRLHQGARPIFNQYSIEDQIESIYQPQVSLPSGGSIVIDPTEALVAIDVNSGSTSKGKNFDASIFQANLEAASELARQLRLRDLGGLIVVDFIDMRNKKHILAVEKEVKTAMKKDKAKVDFSRISKFGLMQISRQKLGAPIEAGNYRRCEHCKGRGTVRSVETISLYYLRRIQTGASRKPVEAIECHFPLDVASYLLNQKRGELSELEKKYKVQITITAEVEMKPADNEIIFHKAEKETNSKKQA